MDLNINNFLLISILIKISLYKRTINKLKKIIKTRYYKLYFYIYNYKWHRKNKRVSKINELIS